MRVGPAIDTWMKRYLEAMAGIKIMKGSSLDFVTGVGSRRGD